jgi:hypothetical protein
MGVAKFKRGLIAPSFAGTIAANLLQYAEVDLATADVIDTAAGRFGSANGLILLPSPGTGKVIEIVSVILSITFGTAGFTAGGNVSVCWGGGGAAISGTAAANITFGAGANAVYQFKPLTTAGNALVPATGVNLKAAAAFTNTGGATGSAKVFTVYRVHTL